MRPLTIHMPTWDGKLVLAGLLIIGYYVLVLAVVVGTPAGDLTPVRAGVTRDALLTLGPPIGLVFGALFRNTAAEERRDALRSTELTTAITTPSTTTTNAAAPSTEDLGDQVEEGAEAGARKGVAEGIERIAEPLAYDRVDRGRFASIEPIVAPLQPVVAPPAPEDAADPATVPAMPEDE